MWPRNVAPAGSAWCDARHGELQLIDLHLRGSIRLVMHVNVPWLAADRAVLDVSLVISASRIQGDLRRLGTVRTDHAGGEVRVSVAHRKLVVEWIGSVDHVCLSAVGLSAYRLIGNLTAETRRHGDTKPVDPSCLHVESTTSVPPCLRVEDLLWRAQI